MSEALRHAIRDGNLLSAARRRARAGSSTVIICEDPAHPTTPEDRARLRHWIGDELAKE